MIINRASDSNGYQDGLASYLNLYDSGGTLLRALQFTPASGSIIVAYDANNSEWVIPVTSDRIFKETTNSESLYAGTFGRYFYYVDVGVSATPYTINLQMSASSLLEGASQKFLCRGAKEITINSPSSDIIDPTDGAGTETPTNSVTFTAHSGIIEIIVNSVDQYIISAPLANLSDVAISGAYSDLSGTPTNVSTFTNDAGYLTDITGENLGDLSDVTISSATSGQVLSYNGASWVNAAAASGGGWTYSAITADPANAQAGYHYSCTGTFTITLPTSGVSAGEEIRVKNMGTGTITIDPQTQNIDGSTTDYTLDVQYSAITLVSTGAHWEIV
jgi:hypothetical protein